MSYFPSLSHTPDITPSITPGLTQHQHGNLLVRTTPTGQTPTANATRMRLLMPTVRPPRIVTTTKKSPTTTTTSRSPRLKPVVASKLIRSRSSSATQTSPEPVPHPQIHVVAPQQTTSNIHANLNIDVRPPDAEVAIGLRWLGKPCKFEIVQEKLQISGYQMYAVEKWIVERTRPVTVLTVYTGDPLHNITVTALSPSSTLTPSEAKTEWDSAMHHLRRDGARPKETSSGTIHTTSLAFFRSDFTIVHIPHGDFLAAQSQLYANIGLLRMGCSGRSAVGLDDVSETTKDRFLSMYHLPDPSNAPASPAASVGKSKSKAKSYPHLRGNNHKEHSLPLSISPLSVSISASDATQSQLPQPTLQNSYAHSHPQIAHNLLSKSPVMPVTASPIKTTSATTFISQTSSKDRTLFNATVLELVRLIQAALAISGMFPLCDFCGDSGTGVRIATGVGTGMEMETMEMDGLLCDITVEGIQKWVGEIGESSVGVEPMERVADPSVVSALLSLVLVTRNKLAAIGYSHIVPKDPFLHPQAFCAALAAFAQSQSQSHTFPSSSTSLSISSSFPFHITAPHTPFYTPHSFTPTITVPSTPSLGLGGNPNAIVPNVGVNAVATVYLTLPLVNSIATAFRSRSSDYSRKVHRVLLNKLDYLATDLRGTSNGGGARGGGEIGSGAIGGGSEDDDGFFGRAGKKGGSDGLGVSVGEGRRTTGGEKGDGGSGGGQLLSGIGSLASGLGFSGNGSGAGALLEPTSDLGELVRVLVSSEKRRGKEREGHKSSAREGGEGRGIAASLRGLWSGRVGVVVKMRERERERLSLMKGENERDKEKEREKSGTGTTGVVSSDGDTDGGKTTDEDNEFLFGGMWSGKMREKLGVWTKRSRPKKASMDFAKNLSNRHLAPPMSNESSSSAHYSAGGALTSPTLPPIVTRDAVEGEDLLSSGQVSPISGAHPFNLGNAEDSTTNLPNNQIQEQNASAPSSILDYASRIKAFDKKRPWPVVGKGAMQSRVPSWSDPISARNILDEDEMEQHRYKSSRSRSRSRSRTSSRDRLSFRTDHEGIIINVSGEDRTTGDDEHRRRLFRHRAHRRHSFHDTASFEHVRVLPVERMLIDVGLCGQMLIMRRREAHLQNVLLCLQAITTSLSDANASLREDHLSHQHALFDIEARTKVIAQIEAERIKANTATQERNTLLYESEQFRVHELWRMASPPRQKVLDLRERVFGSGRRLPAGVRGAHGRFNRVQWTLNGEERLVDLIGRTESEVEEEGGLEAMGIVDVMDEEDEDVVEHPGIKPMWLLRFFTSWGASWSAKKEEPAKESSQPHDKTKETFADADALAAPAGDEVAEPTI